MTDLVPVIRERYARVRERIERAARAAGRDAGAVRLVVVSKGQPLEVVRAAIRAGVRLLGENYAEEGLEKMRALSTASGVEWHMIGHVQSRKARLVVEHYALLHSLDSLRLAERLERFAAEAGRILPLLLEFNLGGEESKYGWPAWQEERWDELPEQIAAVLTLPHLQVRGVMAMPPLADTPDASRPYFRRLRRLREFLAARFPPSDWSELSMGTSVDFEQAVEEGATLVRVGQAILGPRPV